MIRDIQENWCFSKKIGKISSMGEAKLPPFVYSRRQDLSNFRIHGIL